MQCKCGNEIELRRWQLGAKSCLQCGEKAAQVEILAKQQRTGPLFNKGGYMYLGEPKAAKDNALSVGRKDVAIPTHQQTMTRVSLPEPKNGKDKLVKRTLRQKGVYWLDGDRCVWWEGKELPETVTRYVIFDQVQNFSLRKERA